MTSVWRGELASCVAFITSENTCCCLSSSLFLVLQISSSSSRSPKRHPPSAPHSPLLLPLHFIDSIVFSLCSIFCFVSSPLSTHSTPGFSTNPSTSFICSSSTFSLSLLLFCFCWCVSLSARPCHSCMRERTPGARRVE